MVTSCRACAAAHSSSLIVCSNACKNVCRRVHCSHIYRHLHKVSNLYLPIPKIIHTAAVAIPYITISAHIAHNIYRTASMIITLSRMFEHFKQPAEIPIEKKSI